MKKFSIWFKKKKKPSKKSERAQGDVTPPTQTVECLHPAQVVGYALAQALDRLTSGRGRRAPFTAALRAPVGQGGLKQNSKRGYLVARAWCSTNWILMTILWCASLLFAGYQSEIFRTHIFGDQILWEMLKLAQCLFWEMGKASLNVAGFSESQQRRLSF